MNFSHRSVCALLGAVLSLSCVLAPARGSVVLYTTASDYYAATTDNKTVDFTGIAPVDNYKTIAVPPGLDVGGVNFTIDTASSNGSLYVVDGGFSNNFFHVTILDSQFSSSTNDNIVITLPYAVTAAAFNFGSNIGLDVSFLLSTGDSFTRGTAPQQIQFVGLTSSTPFTTIELSQALNGGLVIQDFTFSPAVPEPTSIALVATGGLIVLGHGVRRRRTAARSRA